jgi:uroporphyrinogen-III synthase
VSGPLTGITLVVTRPAAQAERFLALATAAGARCVPFPTLVIEPVPPDAAALQRARAHEWDWIVYTSANAVEHGVSWLPLRTTTAHSIAVGQATERALRSHGFEVDARPEAANSEGILALDAFAQPAGQRVLIVKGRGGRDLLHTELAARGADVHELEVYVRKRALPTEASSNALHDALAGEHTFIAVTSADVLEALLDLVPPADAARVCDVPLVVPGARVAAAARRLGWRGPVVQSTTAEDAAMLEALRMHRDGRLPDA